MKMEMDESSAYVVVFTTGVVALAVVIIVLICISYQSHTAISQAAIKAGLEEVNDATQSTHWGKK